MAGLISDQTGQWLRDNMGRHHVGPGAYDRNYGNLRTFQAFHVRLLSRSESDYATHVEVFIPFGGWYAVYGSGGPGPAYTVMEGTITGVPSTFDADVQPPTSQDYPWWRCKLAPGEALWLLATVRGRWSVMDADSDRWMLAHTDEGDDLPSLPAEATHAVAIAARSDDGRLIQQIWGGGSILLYATANPQAMAQDSDYMALVPTGFDPATSATATQKWRQGGTAAETGSTAVRPGTPFALDIVTRVLYDISDTHEIRGYRRTLQFSPDGRLVSVSGESPYVIDTAVEATVVE